MFSGFPLFPPQASTVAARVDALYFFLIAISTFFSILIATLLVVFVVRYRRRRDEDLPRPIHGSLALELTWTVIPLIIALGTFVWSADVFVSSRRVPPGAMQVYVVGKRWMWKTQHMTGQREINQLHVPIGVPVKLTMTSEDVIHSFYIPAFRTKQDVIPGRYTTIWFQATQTGTFHLFCAEYCGTKHSQMIGSIEVMEPSAFQSWLAGGATGSPAQEGEKLFQSLACITCHRADAQGRGPRLEGLFGRTVHLSGGQTIVADADYIRESILNPTAKVVEGYQPIMPTFQGLVSEEGIMQLIAYIQSLQAPGAEVVAPPGAGGIKLLPAGAPGAAASPAAGGAASPAPRTP